MRNILYSRLVLLFLLLMQITCAGNEQTKMVTQNTIEGATEETISKTVTSLSKQIYDSMLSKSLKRVAVVDILTLGDEKTGLGVYIADKLTNSLFKYQDKFSVVDRMYLQQLLDEMKLGETGLLDSKTIQQLGNVSGADALVLGKIIELGDSYDISLRMLNTETAMVVAVANSSLRNTLAIANLYDAGLRGGESRRKEFRNVANLAKITVSSEYSSNFAASNVADGIIGVAERGEWASRGQQVGAWIRLTWDHEMEVAKVVLYDRPNLDDEILQAKLSFSNASELMTGPLPNSGQPLELKFDSPKKISWLMFTVTMGKGPNVGLSEIEVTGR